LFLRDFGFNIGTPVDRYYIENFLHKHRKFIKGEVLEIGEDSYSSKYGNQGINLTILNVEEKEGCIQGDLESGIGIPENSFDCIIMTQTLPFLFDLSSAISNIYKMLKPKGYVLATNPCISQISRFDMDRWGDYWRFTPLSLVRLFKEAFQENKLKIESFGNCLSATCFIQGIPAEKLTKEEINFRDKDYPVTLTVVAKK
ncbi:MAG: methyltransferase domain-containing protein, partial [Opitutales bacterium]|nr:methyltransferase domain-containing protein [Opitutales bacterium]